MTENFEYFTLKFIEFQQNNENLQQALKTEENKIISANIFLNEILNFDLIKAFSDLIDLNKKLWTKVSFGTFDKIDFESLSKFFTENFKRLNTKKTNELKKHICDLENENKILIKELEKVLFKQKGINEREKITNIVNAALLRNRDIVSSKSKNDNSTNIDKSFHSNNSLKSSFRRKNHSKSFFIANKAKGNNKNLKESLANNKSMLNENTSKDILDKNSFNTLIVIPRIDDNQKFVANSNTNDSNNNSCLVSNSNNNYISKNNETNTASHQNPYKSVYYTSSYDYQLANQNNNAEPKTMLNNILDRYKNENTNISSDYSGNASTINSYVPYSRLQSKYVNPYVPLNSESNKDAYAYYTSNNSNGDSNLHLSSSQNKFNTRYYAGGTNTCDNNSYNTISNTPNYPYFTSNNEVTNINDQKTNIDLNKPKVYYTSNYNYYDNNNTQLNNQSTIFKSDNNNNNIDPVNQLNSNHQNKIIEGSANDETFGDNKNTNILVDKDANTNTSIKLDDNKNPGSNLVENNKDFSVLSSSMIIDNQDIKSSLNDKEIKDNPLKNTKSFSRLKNSNKHSVSNNNQKLLSIENKDPNSYMDGKRLTFNNIQNTEESQKINKKSKINQRLNGILSPNANTINLKQLDKELNRSISPSNSFSVANSTTKNKRNAKSIVKNEINRVSKVVEDFSSTKFLNEFITEKHSKDKVPSNFKKSAEKKREFKNIINNISNKYSLDQTLNMKSKQKIVNGRNIAMMRQKTANNVVKVNQQNNKNINNNNNNLKLKNLELNNKGKNRSKSKTPKREKEIIFDNKSLSEKFIEQENFENKNSTGITKNKLYSSINNNNNVLTYSNMNNKLISNNSNSVGNLSNLNSSYENQNVNKNFNPNYINSNDYQGYQNHSNNPAFMNSNMSNIFSNNNSVNIANLDNNNFNYNQ